MSPWAFTFSVYLTRWRLSPRRRPWWSRLWRSRLGTGRRWKTSSTVATSPWTTSSVLPGSCGLAPWPSELPLSSRCPAPSHSLESISSFSNRAPLSPLRIYRYLLLSPLLACIFAPFFIFLPFTVSSDSPLFPLLSFFFHAFVARFRREKIKGSDKCKRPY